MDCLSEQDPAASLHAAPESPTSRRPTAGAELRKPPTPRCLRLNVRDNRKEAIATSSTLDFVALSACDEDDVAQCDDTHWQTEALKRSRTPPTTRRPAADAKCQRTLQLGLGSTLRERAPPSEHLSSEGGPSSELGAAPP